VSAKLQGAHPTVVLEAPLGIPFNLTAANSVNTHVTTKVCAMQLTLMTSARLVVLCNFLSFFVDGDDLLVVGRGTCDRLGLNLREQLDEKAAGGGSLLGAIGRQHSLRMTIEGLRKSAAAYREQQGLEGSEAEEAPNPDEAPEGVHLGEEHPEITDAALKAALERTVSQSLTTERVAAWREGIWSVRQFWRTSLGGEPAANMEPMKVRLEPGSIPACARLRTYSPVKGAWLALSMSMLIAFGLLFANPQAVYASSPLVRKKHGAGCAGDMNSHRMTVDLRMINSMTEYTIVPTSHAQP
jgi:hypothetical protein